jgi:hypothetical protein
MLGNIPLDDINLVFGQFPSFLHKGTAISSDKKLGRSPSVILLSLA